MKLIDIANSRLIYQQIASPRFTSVKELVAWMGALQAQDAAMVKWAVGMRLLVTGTEQRVNDALDDGEILRTHALRPTWHLVTPEDIRWMLALTAPQIRTLTKARHKDLGLTEGIFSKSHKIIEKLLRDGNHATREEIIPMLNKAGINTDENRASHIFMELELDGLMCSGKIKNGKQTFALLDERAPQMKPFKRDEALAMLAERYFQSRCPATLDDFVWWSGLSKGDAKQALEMVKPKFASEVVDGKTYWLSESLPKPSKKESAYLLPAYDEFIISYKDRSATLTFENHKRAVSINGVFNPTIVVNGETVGVWKRTFKKDNVLMEFKYFEKPNKAALGMIEQEAKRYAEFLGKGDKQ